MTSEELANAIKTSVDAVQSRILGVGKDQYDYGDTQTFEKMTISELIDWALEEANDQIAYAVMLRIRLTRLKRELKKAFTV
ncbi:hypothetical protein [Nonomuraea lactucae]|uniref:hypothetical protein n=1 Tax=Nonomuraea lactucae TaxID=2249762 RepID=UPI000DE1DE29|nr:hypothetical protein [Nonomuraea lactucae]